LTPGDTIQFRWRFTSDPGADFKGFYLDDIGITNIRLPNSCTAVPGVPMLVSAASRLNHGGTPFAAPMALDGSGIEPRDGQGNYTIVLHFDQPIQSGTATVMSGTGNVGAVSFSGNDMLVNLSGVANVQRLTLTANNVASTSGGLLSAVNLTIGFLIGDVNANGIVSNGDVSVIQAQVAQTVGASNFREDVNANGTISNGDVSITQAQIGTTLP
jgi:hypothetical protein